jgi:hypothetical protein
MREVTIKTCHGPRTYTWIDGGLVIDPQDLGEVYATHWWDLMYRSFVRQMQSLKDLVLMESR